MLPNNNPTPPKHTNQSLYMFSYSGVFLLRQSLSVIEGRNVSLPMAPDETNFSMKVDQICRKF